MSDTPTATRWWALVLAAFEIPQIASRAGVERVGGGEVGLGAAALAGLPQALLWTVAVWVILRLTSRFPIGRAAWARNLWIHLGAAGATVLADWGLNVAMAKAFAVAVPENASAHLFGSFLLYTLLGGLAHAVQYARWYRQKEVDELRLRTGLAEAALGRARSELRALKMEINPPFLFSALHTARGLLRDDPGGASRVLIHLSELLRQSLTSRAVQEVSLVEELEYLQPYLDIERVRLGDRLRVAVEVAPGLGEESVPHQLLQPMVEGAIRGLADAPSIAVTIGARRAGGALELAVASEGAVGSGTPISGGEMEPVRERLRQLYGAAAELRVDTTAAGSRVTVRIDADAEPEFGAVAPAPVGARPSTPPPEPRPIPVPAPSKLDWPRLWSRLGWAALALWFAIEAARAYAEWLGARLSDGSTISPPVALAAALLGSAIVAATLVVAFRAVDRFPIRGAQIVQNLLILLALGIATGAVLGISRIGVAFVLDYVYTSTPMEAVVDTIRQRIGGFMVLVGIAHAVQYARRYRQKEVDELRLKGELALSELERARTQLRALKMELNPHFLFNALHAVHSLVRDDLAAAGRMLEHLGELLRRSLANLGVQEVSLGEELDGLRAFVEIERIRYGSGLEVEWRIEPAALTLAVPHMILQPLVENAIRHGLGARGGQGRVEVAARVEGDGLAVEVADDGVGPGGSARGTGVGLANVRERLQRLYGDEATFSLRARDGGGTVALVRVPRRARADQWEIKEE